MKKLTTNKKVFFYIFAFVIPAIVFSIILLFKGIYPFGNSSLLKDDMNYQYVNFFSYYKENFGHISSFLYSTKMTLGGNMFGFTCYYLLSPINLILLFFPGKLFSLAIYLMTTLKISLAGLFMYLFLIKQSLTFKKNVDFYTRTLIFSSAYSMMSFFLVYSMNILWFDSITLFPLVMLGIQQILHDKSSLLYIFSLSASLILNYYIGFMICIFSVLFYVYQTANLLIEKKALTLFSSFIRFSISSLLSGLISSLVLLPTMFSLHGVKGTIPYHFNLSQTYTASDFVLKLFGGTFYSNKLWFGPNIYVGAIVSVLCLLYFLDKSIKLPSRILTLIFLIFLFFNSYISGLNLIWHGFSAPQGYPNRWAFMFSFFFIYIAFIEFNSRTRIKESFIIKAFFGFILLCLIFSKLYPDIFSSKIVIYNMIIISLSCLGLLIKYTSTWRFSNYFLLSIILLDVFANGYFSFSNGYQPINNYPFVNYVSKVQPTIREIQKSDDSFYRIGANFQRSENDPFLLNYNGISHYSSSESLQNINFLSSLGYLQNSRWTNFNGGSTASADSFLGIKYNLTASKKLASTIKANGGLAHYNFLAHNSSKYITISKNDLALNIATVTTNKLTSFDLIKKRENIFTKQNLLYSKLLNHKIHIFDNIKSTNIKKISPTKVMYNLSVPANGTAYIYFPSKITTKNHFVSISINNHVLSNINSDTENGIINIGNFKSGETIKLEVKVKNPEDLNSYMHLQSSIENRPALKKAVHSLKKNKTSFIHPKENKFVGFAKTNHASNLLFSIPYDPGWRVSVNGKNVKTTKALGNLLSFPIPAGKNKIKLVYVPPMLTIGLIISLISILLTIIFVRIEKNFLVHKYH